MVEVSGFITAGGRSSRMGRDKAWLELDGRSMIGRVIEALTPVTTSLNIIANSPDYARLGFPVFADSHQGVGPLEAIRTALANSPTEWIVLAGCDMPFVTTELFALLLSIANAEISNLKSQISNLSPQPLNSEPQAPDSGLRTQDSELRTQNSGLAAVVPLNANGLTEPLCALYSTSALQAVTELIDSGKRKVSLLFERIPTRRICVDEITNLPGAGLFFENINTPEDYERMQKSLIFQA
jgi:molybdenum cofactor guanylyltransferase